MSRLLKEAVVRYPESEILIKGGKGGQEISFQKSRWRKRTVLSGCSMFSKWIKVNCEIPEVTMHCSKMVTSFELNRLFTGTRIQTVLEERYHKIVDRVFTFVAAFTDRATGCTKKAPRTVIHSESSALAALFVT